MPTFCVSSPVPTLASILEGLQSSLTFPPPLTLPPIPGLPRFGLPCLPSPIMLDVRMPNVEMVTAAIEMQAFALQKVAMGMLDSLLSVVGQSLESFLPKMPILNLSLIDLLAGNPDAVMAAVKAAIANRINVALPSLVIPFPFYPTYTIPAMEAVQTMQLLVSNYMQGLVTKITSLVGQVCDILDIGFPTFPVIPTPEAIMENLLNTVLSLVPALPGLPNIAQVVDLIRTGILNPASLLPAIGFPGLPSLPALPDPLIPSFRIPDIEFNMMLTALGNNIVMGAIQPIFNFVSSILSVTVPPICITF